MKVLVMNKAISNFTEVAETQQLKGIKKYSKELDAIDFEHDWLEMAKEELTDGFMYLKAEQLRRDFIVAKIESIMEGNTENTILSSLDLEREIKHWTQLLNLKI